MKHKKNKKIYFFILVLIIILTVSYFWYKSITERDCFIQQDLILELKGMKENLLSYIFGREKPKSNQFIICGKIIHDGKAISTLTDVEPRFSIDDSRLQFPSSKVKMSFDKGTSEYRLEGTGSGQLAFHTFFDSNEENPDYHVGDYWLYKIINVPNNNQHKEDIVVPKIFRLFKPVDSSENTNLSDECNNKQPYENPVLFKWEDLGEDVIYYYSVGLQSCSSWRDYKEYLKGETKETQIEFNLPPNNEGKIYRFDIYAKKDDKHIGYIVIHGDRSYTWHYPFKM